MESPRIGIVANTLKLGAKGTVAKLEARFTKLGVQHLLETETASLFDRKGVPLDDLIDHVDMIALLGGDGTLLHLAKSLGPRVKPIAAINIGNLGFLTLGTESELDEMAEWLVTGNYRISNRSVIRVRTYEGTDLTEEQFALNEVAVNRGSVTRLIHIDLRIDGSFVTRYSSDGLIIATPTGSTAYSLSAGGPVIEPTSEVFLVTPVCPHSLSSRPVVVNNASTIEIEAPAQRDNVFMTVDGQISHPVTPTTRIEICRAPFDVPLVTAVESSFFHVLSQKLDWSGSNS